MHIFILHYRENPKWCSTNHNCTQLQHSASISELAFNCMFIISVPRHLMIMQRTETSCLLQWNTPDGDTNATYQYVIRYRSRDQGQRDIKQIDDVTECHHKVCM